jgi:hypothetical protein
MFALDLFNTKYERELQEGALDDTISRTQAHLMEPLSRRAAEIRTQLRAGELRPMQIQQLEREYEDLVDKRMKILKGEITSREECMGYGGLGEAGLPDVADKQAKMAQLNQPNKAGTDLVSPQQRVAGATPPSNTTVGKAKSTFASFANWLAGGPDTGPTYETAVREQAASAISPVTAAKYAYEQMRKAYDENRDIATIQWMNNAIPITMSRNQLYHTMTKLQGMSRQNRNQFALQTLANRDNFALWLGAQKKVATRPTLKQPADPFQPNLTGYAEPKVGTVSERAQKKNSEKEVAPQSPEVQRYLTKVRRQSPNATSDLEAIAKDELEKQARVNKNIDDLEAVNARQDAALKKAITLDRRQDTDLEDIENQINQLQDRFQTIKTAKPSSTATTTTPSTPTPTVGATTAKKKPEARAKTVAQEPPAQEPQARAEPEKQAEPEEKPTLAPVDPKIEKKIQGLETLLGKLERKQQNDPTADIEKKIADVENRLKSLADLETARINALPAQAAQALNLEPGDSQGAKQTKRAPRVQAPLGDLDIEPAKTKSAKQKFPPKPVKSKARVKPKKPAPAATADDDFDVLGLDNPNANLDPAELAAFDESTADQFGQAVQQANRTGKQLQQDPAVRRIKQQKDYELMLKKELANRIQDRDESDDEQDFQDVDEGRMNELSLEYEDWKRMAPVSFLNRYKISKEEWYNKYRSVVEPKPTRRRMSAQLARSPVGKKMNAMYGSTCPGCGRSTNPDRCVCEGYQDFKKVEPYAVCLAGKPVKKFDYYEQARQFHDNWKKKLYREGNTEKADKITLMPIMDEAANPAQQAAIAVAMKKAGKKPKSVDEGADLINMSDLQFYKELLGVMVIPVAAFGAMAWNKAMNAIKLYRAEDVITALQKKGVTVDRSTLEQIKPLLLKLEQAIDIDKDGDVAKELAKRIQQTVTWGKLKQANPRTDAKTTDTELGEEFTNQSLRQNIPGKSVIEGFTIVYDRATKKVDILHQDQLLDSFKYTGAPTFGQFRVALENKLRQLRKDSKGPGKTKIAPNRNYDQTFTSGLSHNVDLPLDVQKQMYQQHDQDTKDYGITSVANPGKWAAIRRAQAAKRELMYVHKHPDAVEGHPSTQEQGVAEGELREDAIPAKMVMQGFVVEYDPGTRTVVISKRGQELEKYRYNGQASLLSFQRNVGHRIKSLEDDLYGGDDEAGAVSLSRVKVPGRGYGYQELGEDDSSTSSDEAESAILKRIMVAHLDLLKEVGPEKVMQAVEEVAYNIGDLDEIGSSDSDVSGWVHQVRDILGVPEPDQDEFLDEKWSTKYKRSIDCSHPKGFSQRAHCAGRKK